MKRGRGRECVVVVQTTTARLMHAYVEKSVENVEKKFFMWKTMWKTFFMENRLKKRITGVIGVVLC